MAGYDPQFELGTIDSELQAAACERAFVEFSLAYFGEYNLKTDAKYFSTSIHRDFI